MADDRVPIKIRQSDLVGDCVRLNRRFDLTDGRISEVGAAVSSVQEQVTTLARQTPAATAESSAQPLPLAAPATSNLTLNTGFQLIPGMEFDLTKKGWWKFDVTARCVGAIADAGDLIIVGVQADGVDLPGAIIDVIDPASFSSAFAVTHRSWLFQSKTGVEHIRAVGKKSAGAGASILNGDATASSQVSQIVAVWVGP